MHQFLFHFDHAYNKLQMNATTISDDLLDFKLFKAAKLLALHN